MDNLKQVEQWEKCESTWVAGTDSLGPRCATDGPEEGRSWSKIAVGNVALLLRFQLFAKCEQGGSELDNINQVEHIIEGKV